jgi:TatD DNase family protein
MFVDVHCHLNYDDYGDVDLLINKCVEKGIGKLVTVGFDIQSSLEGKRLAEKYSSVYFAAGFHPTELKKYKQGDLDIIKDLCSHEKCVALGEIGLDYHYPDTDKQLQKEIFVRQLELADEINMPVQIHSRDCADDMLEILSENSSHLKSGALLHCYSHSSEMAQRFLKLGICFSFGGTSTYKGSKRARKSISAIPLQSLMTETDSPYLPPASLYGSFPNTPLSIPEIAQNMADIKGIAIEELQNIVWDNAHRLFKKLK